MKHVTTVEQTPSGYLGRCETCGERNVEFTGYPQSMEWCDDHEYAPRKNQRGGKMGLKTLEKFYRERSGMMIYTPEERAQWLVLADEIAERYKHKKDTIEGQLPLFDTDEGETS